VHGQSSRELNARLLFDAFDGANWEILLRMRNRDDAALIRLMTSLEDTKPWYNLLVVRQDERVR
jgi:hypothetical protein